MDDICESKDTVKEARKLTEDKDKVLKAEPLFPLYCNFRHIFRSSDKVT